MQKELVLLVAVFGLTGCADGWEKPRGEKQEFERTYYECLNSARARYPGRTRAITDETRYKAPLETTRYERRGKTAYFLPIDWSAIIPTLDSDDKEDEQRQALSSCMAWNGWQLTFLR